MESQGSTGTGDSNDNAVCLPRTASPQWSGMTCRDDRRGHFCAAYLGRRRGRGRRLGHLDVLHLDGVLRVGLRVMELAHVHSGLLRLVRGRGLEGEKQTQKPKLC